MPCVVSIFSASSVNINNRNFCNRGELKGMIQKTVMRVSELASLRVKQVATGGSGVCILAEPPRDSSTPPPSNIPWGYSNLDILYTDKVKQVAVYDRKVIFGHTLPHHNTTHTNSYFLHPQRLELHVDSTVTCDGVRMPALPCSIKEIATTEGYSAALSG